MSTPTFRIASIPGDGIGTEITEAAIQVLTKLQDTVGTFKLDFTNLDWSSENFKKRGWYMPEDGLEQLKKYDAIYFGAVGWPDVPDHISLWGLILPIRKVVSTVIFIPHCYQRNTILMHRNFHSSTNTSMSAQLASLKAPPLRSSHAARPPPASTG